MKRYLASIAFFMCAHTLPAQMLHTPADIDVIIEKSKTKYYIDTLTMNYDKKPYDLPQGEVVLDEQNKLMVRPYKLANEANFDKAETYFKQKKYAKARQCYQKTLSSNIGSPLLMLKIGKTYAMQKDFLSARHWFAKGLAINPKDYELHHQAALACLEINELQNAKQHIIYAHIYNRMGDNVLKDMKNIFAKNQVTFADWQTQPQCNISVVNKDVKVHYRYGQTPWLGFAKTIAVWLGEEGYEQKMLTLSTSGKEMIMYKEAMLNALILFENLQEQEKTNYPALNTFNLAIAKQFTDEYIIYEILAMENPLILYQLPKENLDRIVEYLQNIKNLHFK